MNGYRSNTGVDSLSKNVLLYTRVQYFQLFCFQDMLCALSMISYHVIRHRDFFDIVIAFFNVDR